MSSVAHLPHRHAAGRNEARQNVTGRPPRFTDRNELERLIELYFEQCDNHVTTVIDKKTGEETLIKKPRPYTMVGLMRALGFRSRNSILHYEGKEEFCDLIIDARLRIEEQRNEQLIDRSGIPGGIIFDLKNNHGWRDESSVEVTGSNGGPVQVELVGMPPAPRNMQEWTEWYKSMAAASEQPQEVVDADYQVLSLPDGGEPAGVEPDELRPERVS